MNPKRILRRQILSHRKLMSKGSCDALSHQVKVRFFQLVPLLPPFQTVHSFLPIATHREVDTVPIINGLVRSGKKVMVSKTNFADRSMQHFLFDDKLVLQPDQYQIPSPVKGNEANIGSVDLILIPLLAADKKGGRIGYGKGFYDELLKKLKEHTVKVGLNLAPCFDSFTFLEEHDECIDYCVTPMEVVDCH